MDRFFSLFQTAAIVVNGIKSDWAPVLSGVPQGTVLGPVLFSLYINDITTDIDSEMRLFADDCVCYREIKGIEDTVKLQEDIDRLGCWARKWGMRFQPVKCNIMQITRKRIKKINASYNLEGTVLDSIENIKYLGVTITNDLKWNTHVSNICTKANMTHGFLRRTSSACPQDVKESTYKGLVGPVLEYGCSVWDPSSILLQEELEKVQKRAARFVTGNYIYETGSMTGILEQLKWESLKKRSRDSRIIMLNKSLKGAACIPTNDLVPPPPTQLGMSEITTLWHFKPPLLIRTFTSAASFPRLLEIGIHLQILSLLLLKEQKTLLLSSLLL